MKKINTQVTSRITHATPAAFAAHVAGREDESQIALQEIGEHKLGRVVDLMYGGGKCFFLPNNSSNSCRSDNINVLEKAKKEFGWTIGNGLQDFHSQSKLPLMNLFSLDHMPYDIDRQTVGLIPSLAEMAGKALQVLSQDTFGDKGFF